MKKDVRIAKIDQYIERHMPQLIVLTQDLIRIPTVNPPGDEYETMVRMLEKTLRGMNVACTRVYVPVSYLKKYKVMGKSPRIILLGRYTVNAGAVLHLNGHYDVVPVVNSTRWKYDPFKAVIAHQRIYGRGSEDMKGTIACMLFCLKAILATGNRPSVNIEYSFVPDEETGGRTGFGYLVKKGLIHPDYAIGEGASGRYICHGNNGVLWAEVQIKGKSAHASEPEKGINAFEIMNAVAGRLAVLRNKVQKRTARFTIEGGKKAQASLVLGGVANAGVKINIVPEYAQFSIDRRLIPGETIAQAKQEILACIKDAMRTQKGSLQCTVVSADAPIVVPTNTRICKVAGDAVREVFHGTPEFVITRGATDMRFFIYKNIPFIGYGAQGLGRMHSVDECVSMKSLVETTKVFARIMMGLGKV